MDEYERIINWLTRRTADEMEVAAAEAITKLRAELAAKDMFVADSLDACSKTGKELQCLRAELVEYKRDAERYRWLRRARMNVDVLVREDEDSVWLDMHGWDLDAYVDAALAAKEE